MSETDGYATDEKRANQARLNLRFATELTRALRESEGGGWQQVRNKLAEEGISPEDAAVGILMSDDGDCEFGVLATRDGRSFTFDFRDLERGPTVDFLGDARLHEWEELKDERSKWTYSDYTEYAHQVLDQDRVR